MTPTRPFFYEGLELALPRNWEDESKLVFLGPPGEGGYRPSLVMTVRPLVNSSGIDAFAAAHLARLDLAARPEVVVHESGVRPVGARRTFVLRLERDAEEAGGRRLRQDQYAFIEGKRTVLLVFSCAADRYATMVPQFESIAASATLR